ncbi:hypothetical protein GCM10027176_63900 [Actinoallomurus bryophytorum]
MPYGRDQVGEGFAGTGAGLDGEMLPRADGMRHRLGHLHLPGPLRTADTGYSGGEKGGDVGQVGLVRGVEEVVWHDTKRYR